MAYKVGEQVMIRDTAIAGIDGEERERLCQVIAVHSGLFGTKYDLMTNVTRREISGVAERYIKKPG
ncbi:MAG: hypothetical protein AB7L13_07165 [Acidimicrobiia bacterium]